MAKKNSFQATVEGVRMGTIVVPMEAHSTQRGQPLRMHRSVLWKHRPQGQRVPPTRSNEWREMRPLVPGKDLAIGRSTA